MIPDSSVFSRRSPPRVFPILVLLGYCRSVASPLAVKGAAFGLGVQRAICSQVAEQRAGKTRLGI